MLNIRPIINLPQRHVDRRGKGWGGGGGTGFFYNNSCHTVLFRTELSCKKLYLVSLKLKCEWYIGRRKVINSSNVIKIWTTLRAKMCCNSILKFKWFGNFARALSIMFGSRCDACFFYYSLLDHFIFYGLFITISKSLTTLHFDTSAKILSITMLVPTYNTYRFRYYELCVCVAGCVFLYLFFVFVCARVT